MNKNFLSNSIMDRALKSVKNIFDENKQLKAELRELKKNKKEALNKIKELKKKQTKAYQRDAEVQRLKEEKKKLLKEIKEHQAFKREKEERQRRKQTKSVSRIEKWYKSLERKQYSVKILMYRCYDFGALDEASQQKKIEEFKRKKVKHFFKYIYEYLGDDKYKVEKVMYAQIYRPNYISVKMSKADYDKFHNKYTFREDVLKDRYQQLIIDRTGKLSKPQQRTMLNNTQLDFNKIVWLCQHDGSIYKCYISI